MGFGIHKVKARVVEFPSTNLCRRWFLRAAQSWNFAPGSGNVATSSVAEQIMSSLSESERTLRLDLAAAFHLAVADDLHEGIANHFSAVLPDGKHFLVNPFGLHFSEVTASNLVVCDLEGRVVRGEGEPAASAHHIHAPIHRLVPRAKVLLHTHQPHATALAMLKGGRLEWALHTSCRLYGRVAYDTDYDGVALADSVGERMARMLDDAEVLFLGNHGVMTVAATVAQGYDDLYFVERAARTQLLAMSTGKALAELNLDLVRQVAAQTRHERFELGYIERHFAARKRLLDAAGGSYRD
jgi:ribulose-5-phosphate 4-epimerase/fuculose-1-phosphate aldolase